MREPVQPNNNKGPVSKAMTIPAPTGGWNARDNLASMDANDAYDMENMFTYQAGVTLRRGTEDYATVASGTVETLMEYASATDRELFAVSSNDSFYDVTAGGVGVEVAGITGSSGRWQHTMFANSAGHYLIACNGGGAAGDTVLNYDGTTWNTVPVITGTDPTKLIHVCAHNRVLYFVKRNKLEVWYLATEAIGGAATKFDLAPLCKLGGYLQAMYSWTVDGGAGQDDLAVFLTSQGEVLVFSGLNPGDSTWLLKGVYTIGRPIGRRCAMNLGGDLIVITEDGYIPLSRILPSSRARKDRNISDKISKAVNDLTRMNKALFGWQPILFPQTSMGIINVPLDDGTSFVQHVFNSNTGAWSRFTGLNASCWSTFNDELYFGTVGKVVKADTGFNDNGDPVVGFVKPAFSYFGSGARQKRWTAMRPIFLAGTTAVPFGDQVTPTINFNVDFQDNPAPDPATVTVSNPALWGTAIWGVSTWPALTTTTGWLSLGSMGFSGSPCISVATTDMEITLLAIDYIFEAGGMY